MQNKHEGFRKSETISNYSDERWDSLPPAAVPNPRLAVST
jgi:hypothetical protein